MEAAPPPNSTTPVPPSAESPPPPDPSPPPPVSSSSPPPPPTSVDDSPPPPKSTTNTTSSPPPSPASINFSPPPPPPPKSPASTRSPPPPSSVTPSNSSGVDTSSTSTDSSSSSSLTNVKQLLIGATVGLGLFLLAMVVICMLCAKRKKRKRDHEHGHYYSDHSHGRKGDQGMYYSTSNTPQPQNWHVAPPAGSPRGPWGTQPPPPPPPGLVLSSGERESGNFTGPGPRISHHLPPPSPGLSLGFNQSTFTYDELAVATGGFSKANLLGQGGFGYVHKGVLPNGKEVAVKSLKSGSGQGEREFQAEVEIISRVHHRHLVSLVGYCIAGGQRMLVYEFVRNNTLEHHLYGKDLPTMDWPTRLRIATGAAKGLAYLHEDCHPRIIHRDIKAANILLDNNFEAMVADFGLAKLSSDNYTHVSTRVMGTFGYLAPEYASSGKLTEKSDVFSYGVMLLELITGQKPVDPSSAYMEDSLVDWARPIMQQALEDGIYDELVDPRLENNFNPQEMARMVACAAASIRHSARKRPKMSQIVRALEGDVSLADLNEGVKPGHSSIYTSSGSSEYDMNAYNSDLKKFRQVALTSQEFGESDAGTSSNDSSEMTNHGSHKQH